MLKCIVTLAAGRKRLWQDYIVLSRLNSKKVNLAEDGSKIRYLPNWNKIRTIYHWVINGKKTPGTRNQNIWNSKFKWSSKKCCDENSRICPETFIPKCVFLYLQRSTVKVQQPKELSIFATNHEYLPISLFKILHVWIEYWRNIEETIITCLYTNNMWNKQTIQIVYVSMLPHSPRFLYIKCSQLHSVK